MSINWKSFFDTAFNKCVTSGSAANRKIGMSGKTVVVTGSTSGIGLATVIELAKRGAAIIGVGRSEERCKQAIEVVKNTCKDADITYLKADLSSMDQVRELAADIKRTVQNRGNDAIDVLINVAGAFSSWYNSTVDGFELQFAVNHLAPFLLTNELMPLIKNAKVGRVIMISSGSHYRTKMKWNDIMLRKHYNCLMAYKQSKLANVLFATELNRRMGYDSNVRAFAVDPGLVNTDIGIKRSAGIAKIVWGMRSRSGVAPSVPAASIAYVAGEPSIQHSMSVYWKDCKPLKPSLYSQRQDAALRLWELSEKMCGMKTSQIESKGTHISKKCSTKLKNQIQLE